MKTLNLRFSQAILATLAGVICIAFAGCAANNGNPDGLPVSQTNVAVNQAPIANTNAAPSAPNPALASVPITLPMVEALLSEDSAAAELKSSAQLSDEQIQRLKD